MNPSPAATVLENLISSIRTCRQQLNSPDVAKSLMESLHNQNCLPNKKIFNLASDALDGLKEIQLMLEPAQLLLADHLFGYINTKCLVAAVDYNIPDILASDPATLSNLALSSNTHRDRLGQIMHILYNNGIFAYDSTTAKYSNNRVSALLRTDHWGKGRAWVQLYGNEYYDMARGIPASLKKNTIRTPGQIEYNIDESVFEYFTKQGWNPKLEATINAAAMVTAPGILKDYPWGDVVGKTVLDVGGGGGAMMAQLLREHTTIQGAVMDLPDVIEQAVINFHSPEGQYRDVAEKIPRENLMVGDFTKEVPRFEIYTMKWCLHSWDDDEACIILQNIRNAVIKGDHSRLVILESVLSDGHMGRMSRYVDMMHVMLVAEVPERSEEQWEDLAIRTGWKVNKICALRNAWLCAIEFVPNWD